MPTPPTLLDRALHAPADPPLAPLPPAVADLLRTLGAAPRLAAHLRAVHDVARQLVAWAVDHHPGLVIDREAVLFGAATHDIGKAVHPAELSGPGSRHEEAGSALLSAHGFPPELARFAATHATWTAPGVTLEDLLVSTADKVWKNKRVPELEDLVVARLTEASGRPRWEEFLALDELLERLGAAADARLAFQASFPVGSVSPGGPGR
ncbi:HD domain-containing protein [Streptomyces sp. NPDC004285]